MSVPHKCPACDGRGKREAKVEFAGGVDGFFWDTCAPCKGEGILWEQRADPIPYDHRQWWNFHSPSCACWSCQQMTARPG